MTNTPNPYLEKYKQTKQEIIVVWALSGEVRDYVQNLINNWIKVRNIKSIEELWEINWWNIWNVLLIDEKWPIISEKWNVVSVATIDLLKPDILSTRAEVVGQIWELLKLWIKRVSLISENWLSWELETLKWTWTMFINPELATFEQMDDYALFEMIYAENIANKDWKPRTEEEKQDIFRNYRVLKIWESILWWYQILDFEFRWVAWSMIQCLRCSKQWNWVWKRIIDEIKAQSKLPIFAYTKKVEFFTKMWFEKISWEVSETWAELFVFGGGE